MIENNATSGTLPPLTIIEKMENGPRINSQTTASAITSQMQSLSQPEPTAQQAARLRPTDRTKGAGPQRNAELQCLDPSLAPILLEEEGEETEPCLSQQDAHKSEHPVLPAQVAGQ